MNEVSSLSIQIAEQLASRGETVAVAETTAGGLVAASLVGIAGASKWFLGGVVAYSAAAKARWLNVSPETLGASGAVSAAGAHALAEAVRRSMGATWGVAETGIAGPQIGRRSAKPTGLVYVAVSGPVSATEEVCTGMEGRTDNQRAFAIAALRLLDEVLRRAPNIESPERNNQSAR